MINFHYTRADDVTDAAPDGDLTAKFIAGGTEGSISKEDIEHRSRLIDVGRLPLDPVEQTVGGRLRKNRRSSVLLTLASIAAALDSETGSKKPSGARKRGARAVAITAVESTLRGRAADQAPFRHTAEETRRTGAFVAR